MKANFRCRNCDEIYELEEEAIKNDKYIQCPCCGEIGKNKYYVEDKK